MLLVNTLRFLAFAAGTILHLFLAVLLARKRGPGLVERLSLAVICTAGVWHAASALAFFYRISTGIESNALLRFLDNAAQLGLALTPALLFHLCVAWMKGNPWISLAGYAAVPLSWRLLDAAERAGQFRLLLAAGLLITAGVCILAARRAEESLQRRFLYSFAAALAAPAAVMLTGEHPALVVWAALAAPLCFAYFVYRYDFLGLLISRRIIFALNLGLFSAFYLFLVRRAANFVESEFDVLGRLAELPLIFGAALVWLPLYAWMSRFLSKRAQLYGDFSKRLIEEAARVLELEKRVQFLAEEVGRTFHLRRALLVTAGPARLEGRFGFQEDEVARDDLAELEERTRAEKVESAHAHLTKSPELRRLLERLDFNYLFALRYEDHLTGLLLLDTRPRTYLDEDEPILLGLCRQISHSIETGRVVEEKISLERALLDQEHLARLGKASAAIAHEVKNPLSSIKTLAQLMQEDPEVAQRYSRDLSYMIREIDRLNGSVLQLLSFARPPREVETDVNVSSLLETTAHMLARRGDTNGVRVQCRPGPMIEVKRSNPELIEQVVLNLVLNAVQASEPGSAVLVRAEARPGSKVAIQIEDQGPGIPPELRERVFEPFYTTKQQGTGLGLAIVRKNVHRLRGEIEIESPILDGRGTRVTVILPAQ